ncbi:MAG: hypothetical protein KJ025_18890, partial [Burkholderiales bacterium]|nr:hypothetical protein [Burkholderiales bacterium]
HHSPAILTPILYVIHCAKGGYIAWMDLVIAMGAEGDKLIYRAVTSISPAPSDTQYEVLGVTEIDWMSIAGKD